MKEIAPIVEKIRERRRLETEIAGARELLDTLPASDGLREVAQQEFDALRSRVPDVEAALKLLLLPKDPNDSRNVVLEIRAGTGGDEAALFAGELFRMYVRYAESRGWKVEVIDRSDAGGAGGLKEIQAIVEGEGAYSRLKYEGGRPPGPARPGHRDAGANPHLRRHRRRSSGGRGRGRDDLREGHPRRPLLRVRRRAGRASTRPTPPSG